MGKKRPFSPILSSNMFSSREAVTDGGERMTVWGTIFVTMWLALMLLGGAAVGWNLMSVVGFEDEGHIFLGIVIASAVVGIMICKFAKQITFWVKFLILLYAVLQGTCLGWLSHMMAYFVGDAVVVALLGTIGTLVVMMLCYQMGWIRATERFKSTVIGATATIALIYLVDLIMRLFGESIVVLNEDSLIGMLISVVIIFVAAFNLILDFDFIESSAKKGLPKDTQWLAAYGLIVTIIWIYVEILRFYGKARMNKK